MYENATSLGAGLGVQSPLEVSQNPALTRYKKYLQCYYNARTLAQADKYLPTMESPFISLAIIKKGYHNADQRDEFTRQTLHGGVDQILQNKKPINFETLLSSYEGRKLVKFILVEGPPGIGKSTFAWEICRRWDEIESIRKYNTVVLLKLREKWVLNATSLPDLFRFPPEPDFSKYIADELNKSHGKHLLLVLDGFDEISHSFHEKCVVKSILCRQLLPECTIILTTRPSAKYKLRSILQPQIDKHVEIIGFTEEERVKYILNVFRDEPELQANFLKYMFLVPHIKSMMYIPLNCAIIAQVYYESQCSQNLAIPRTITQLYKALTHSLLVRYMKESDHDYISMLPESLNKEHMDMFKVLAKFAFDTYHKGKSRKVTFFKEDIPSGFTHLGFMNESTEMYASKGIEKTFSFLHLSLQEYLAAWHLASRYSIEFQVAYHKLALSTYSIFEQNVPKHTGCNEEENALLSSLEKDRSSLVEPAIFLAGITAWRSPSEENLQQWESYLSHDTAECREPTRMLLKSLYETQNPHIISQYFTREEYRRDVVIGLGSHTAHTPYDCYALTYCLKHSLGQVNLFIYIHDDDVPLVEMFVKGLIDHCKTTSGLEHLRVWLLTNSLENSKACLFQMMTARFLMTTKEIVIYSKSWNLKSDIAHKFIRSLHQLQHLEIHIDSPTSWEWLTAIKTLSELRILHVSSDEGCQLPPTDLCWPVDHKLTEVILDIKSPSSATYDLCNSTDVLVNSFFKSLLQSNSSNITRIELPNVSREIMADIHNVIRLCPSVVTLELKRTRLGYDGIHYICSALRFNKTLKYLTIDDTELPPSRILKRGMTEFITFVSTKTVNLSCKLTCTDLLLELNSILKDNTTLEGIRIHCGFFLPLSAGEHGDYCPWTGLGALEKFNLGVVKSGMSPNLRRSFSLSDLTHPKTLPFWDRWLPSTGSEQVVDVDFKKFFYVKKQKKKLSSSFSSPDTDILQSFSGLDYRLRECLEIHLSHQSLEVIRETFQGVLEQVSKYSLTRTYT